MPGWILVSPQPPCLCDSRAELLGPQKPNVVSWWVTGHVVKNHHSPSDKVLTMCRKDSRSPLISYSPSLPMGGMGLLLMVEPRLFSWTNTNTLDDEVFRSMWWKTTLLTRSSKVSLVSGNLFYLSFEMCLHRGLADSRTKHSSDSKKSMLIYL